MLWGRKVWRTPDDAIREATARSILDARGIRYDRPRVQGSNDEQAIVLAAQSQVLAVLGKLTQNEERIVVGYAHGLSYTQMAKKLGVSRRTVARRHREARDRVVVRLVALGLLVDESQARSA